MKPKTLILLGLTLPLGAISLIAITPLPVTAELTRDTRINLLLAQNPCPENPNLPCRRSGGDRNPGTNITIISPTRGSLLNNKPTISWSPFPDATSYSVRVEYLGKILWEKTVEKTEISYPNDQPPLELDNDYELIVETVINNEIKSGSVIFRLPNQAKEQKIQSETQVISNSQLNPDQKSIKLAELYQENDFPNEAIEILKNRVENKSQNLVVYEMLGDLYLKVNLPKLAETPYQQALNLATNINDTKSKAEIQFNLGEVYDALEKRQEAIASLTSARASYQSLNNRESAAQVAQYLGELYEAIPNRDLAIQWYETAKTEYKSLGEIERANIMEEKLQDLNQ